MQPEQRVTPKYRDGQQESRRMVVRREPVVDAGCFQGAGLSVPNRR